MWVREAVLDDADAVALVHVRGGQAAYRGLMPQEYLDSLDVAQRAATWRRWLAALSPPRATVVLAHDPDGVVGFAGVGLSRDSDASSGDVGELAAIYVLPSQWGLGGGRLLMAQAVRRLMHAGLAEATLWVLKANERARRFYEAVGWHADGGHKTDDSLGFPLVEVRYRRALPGER